MLSLLRLRLDLRAVLCLLGLLLAVGITAPEPMTAALVVAIAAVALGARHTPLALARLQVVTGTPDGAIDRRAPVPPICRPDAPGRPQPRAPGRD